MKPRQRCSCGGKIVGMFVTDLSRTELLYCIECRKEHGYQKDAYFKEHGGRGHTPKAEADYVSRSKEVV